MSVDQYCARLRQSSLGRNDQQWFPIWIRRYAEATNAPHGPLPVSRESVIAFLRTLRGHGTPAWQRLQATRAIEVYQKVVLRSDALSLPDKMEKTVYAERDGRAEEVLVAPGTPVEAGERAARYANAKRLRCKTLHGFSRWAVQAHDDREAVQMSPDFSARDRH